jgi:exodeoxyribonuclease V gamma subunit
MLHVHRSERADALVAALTALLADPLPDPFAREVVCVPTRGMERWLTQRMSTGLGTSPGRADGVCANVDFPTPARMVSGAVAAASGIDPEQDPWLPERAVWPLLEIVDAALGEPWLARLAHHLGDTGDEARRKRRFTSVRHVAGLFDRYALYRPEMLEAWAAGADGGWQAELWRRLRARLPVPGPAERVRAACAALRADPSLADLPPRVALFGLTRLPAGRLTVLQALAEHRDVHLFLLHPSPAQWERLRGHPPVLRRRELATTATNPLLASWGHDSRELQLVLAGERTDHLHAAEHRGDTLLARVQADVREDRRSAYETDPSIQVHSCHGRARQVEVLRDAILHLLAEDPTLEPRDVIVMCPDIEAFAPLIQATFGAGDDEAEPVDGAPPDLRVRLADRSLRQTNPILGAVARLLELAGERLTASQVLDLADREPVRRRARFDDEAIARLEEWVRASGIRWGLDAAHRAPFKLERLPSGTWQAGLDRLLLGVAMSEDEQRLFGGRLPLDDVESGAIDLAGRFAELIERLHAAVDALRAPKPIGAWAEAIAQAADALTAAAPRDAWQRAELQRILDDVVSEAAGHGAELALPELRALLGDRLKGRPTRANFRTGHLTFCTLVPMRSVPHRVVCLLGLDDGVFPRKAPRDGDDLLLDDPHIGERDPRTEDRQLLLDALMAATDRLIVTYTGNDERTNLPRPPAVAVGELLDLVSDGIVVRHPLQPFDDRNFERDALVAGTVWSFDRVTLRGAQALAGERRPRGRFLPEPLPPLAASVVELDDLVYFVQRPVRAFLRRRLGISVADYSDEVQDALPVQLGGLEEWGVGQRLLDARLAGADRRPAILAEIARGTLPPGALGEPVIRRIEPVVDEIVARVPPGATTSVDVRLALPDGRTLSGTVAGVAGDMLRMVTYSRVSPRHRIAAWVRLLAVRAAYPHRELEAVTVGRSPDGGVAVVRIGGLDAALALDHLVELVDLFDRGMREPAPLYCLTSAAYAAGENARDRWESGRFPAEDAEPEHELVLGGRATFAALMEAPARADERWDPDETRRFGQWARRLWDPVLRHER